jgi:hypothetical protein
MVLVLALVQFPYIERMQGVLSGVPRGHVGPSGLLESAALLSTVHRALQRLGHKAGSDERHEPLA